MTWPRPHFRLSKPSPRCVFSSGRPARNRADPAKRLQVLKLISREVAAQDVLQHPGSTSGPPSSTGDGPVPFAPEPPFSFARAAATAMAKTPMLDASATPFPHAYEGGAPAPDYSAFVNTLVSEDWTAGTFTSPAGDEASLLDQLAATW